MWLQSRFSITTPTNEILHDDAGPYSLLLHVGAGSRTCGRDAARYHLGIGASALTVH